MSTTTWTNERLARLFERYRSRYWPASRRLPSYRVETASLDKALGETRPENRVLLIDISAHASDREVRATLLHEMVHAVVHRRHGHDAAFWTQLEYLLAQRAPVTVGFPELGERGRHLWVVPARFRHCRRLFAPAYRRQQREIERMFAGRNVGAATTSQMETECHDAAVEGVHWRDLWAYQARTWGFIDLDGRRLPWAHKWHAAARRGYVRGRRFRLDEERLRARFEEMKQTTPLNEGRSPVAVEKLGHS